MEPINESRRLTYRHKIESAEARIEIVNGLLASKLDHIKTCTCERHREELGIHIRALMEDEVELYQKVNALLEQQKKAMGKEIIRAKKNQGKAQGQQGISKAVVPMDRLEDVVGMEDTWIDE